MKSLNTANRRLSHRRDYLKQLMRPQNPFRHSSKTDNSPITGFNTHLNPRYSYVNYASELVDVRPAASIAALHESNRV
jgi:hypothetical protein